MKNIRNIGQVSRRVLNLTDESLVEMGFLNSSRSLPFLCESALGDLNLVEWAAKNKSLLESKLLEYGAILFRRFNVRAPADFEQVINAVSDQLLEYRYGSTPRSRVQGSIYTSTEYPANQTIVLHNEMSYSRAWPMKIWFLCLQPSLQGGETPIADSRRVYQRIDPEVRQRFQRKGVMYVRNYCEGLDVPWQKVFQTEVRSEVEAYCRNAGVDYEWVNNDHLRTKQICQAVATHPRTGQPVWFNQAHLFHISNLEKNVQESFLKTLSEADYPRNSYYGDGSPIEPSALDAILAAYREEMVVFNWNAGDILLLDNMLMAHGRLPFTGPRTVVVGMSDPIDAVLEGESKEYEN